MKIFLKVLLGIFLFPFVTLLAAFLGIVYALAIFLGTIYEIFYAIYSDIFERREYAVYDSKHCPDYVNSKEEIKYGEIIDDYDY